MATIDWPTDAAFKPARVQHGQDVPKSGWRGFFTGKRETVSAGSDRLTCLVTLPPCASRAAAQKRAAFLAHVASTGDLVRFGPLWLPNTYPLGTIGGAPTVNGSVAAGSRTVVLANVLSRPNLLFNSGFEIDSDADGLSDGWSLYSGGTTGTVTAARSAYTGATNIGQSVSATNLGTSSSDFIGLTSSGYTNVTAGASYSLSIIASATAACTLNIGIGWYDASSVNVGNSVSLSAANTSAFAAASMTATAPAGATKCKINLVVQARGTSAGAQLFALDNVQLEQAAAASAYAGLATVKAGDFLSIGGNLLEQYYADATATDAGALTLTLARPAPSAISNGAAVTWAGPTGSWQLDDDGIALDYSAGAVQAGIAIPFRQVAV